MKPTKKLAAVFTTTFSLAILTLSCTGGSDGYGDKNELHVNIVGEPTSIHPITSTDGYSRYVKNLTLDSLLKKDPDTFEWQANAAESWNISPDGMTFTFKLREGMTFHDGSPVTAEDVKTYFDALFDETYNAIHIRPYYSLIEKCEVIDPFTIKFVAKERYFQNFDYVASLGPIPTKIYKDAKEGRKKNLDIVGSGPYKLKSFDRGKKIILTKNTDWWGFKQETPNPEHNFDKIHMYFVNDDVVQLENFKKQRFDMLENVQPEVFELKMVGEEWGSKLIKVKAENKSPKSYSWIGWNLRDPKFSDKRVRRALAHLMNKEMMLEKFFYGLSESANGPTYTTSDYNDKSVKPIPFDIEAAKKFFKEAGWSDSNKNGTLDKMINGQRVEMSFTIVIASDAWQRWLTIYKEDAAKAGVNVNIQLLEWNSFLKLIDEAKFDAVAMAWGGGSTEEDFKQIWHSESAIQGGSNRVGYANPEVDRLIEVQRRTLDRKKRLEVSHQIFRMIADDAPYLFMFSRPYDLYAHNVRIWKPKETFKYTVGTSYWKVLAE